MRRSVATLCGLFLPTLDAMSFEQLAASSQFHEDLVLRNVHPFGVVLVDPEALPDEPNGPDGAFCATGEYGALEYWERVRQDGHVFFYCKARHTSTWQPPCVHLVQEFAADDPRRYPFPLSIERLDLPPAVKKHHASSTGDSHEDALESGSTPSDLHDETLSLVEFEEHVDDRFFSFHGTLDHLQGVILRPYFDVIPPGLREHALASLPIDSVHVDSAYNIALHDVVGLEVDLEIVVREALEDDVPDPMVYTVSHFSVEQRMAVADAWADVGTFALARGNVTTAVNAFRRSVHWIHGHPPAVTQLAAVLAALGYLDDACECVGMLDPPAPVLASALKSEFAFCPTLHINDETNKFHPLTMLLLQLATLTVIFVASLWWVQRQAAVDGTVSQSSADKKFTRKPQQPHRGRLKV
ncbi:hypothetical protein DYB30_013360 [Aphanomyces astaci]|uniref:WW domain-containing protein n=1 Tax=Aphanomyces astaci TaxID=112090 RepID=A0A397E397_APHAT|nr:hypothetical protein DYB30_013360 [Aphanomyces astaci]